MYKTCQGLLGLLLRNIEYLRNSSIIRKRHAYFRNSAKSCLEIQGASIQRDFVGTHASAHSQTVSVTASKTDDDNNNYDELE